MKNRAKCKLCGSIIESFHSTDYVICKCGEISLDGGDAMRCAAKNWDNFLRVDDEGNEIIVKVKDLSKYDIADREPYPSDNPRQEGVNKPNKAEMLKMMDEMIKMYEKMSPNALVQPITGYDMLSLLLLLSSILRAESE